MVFFNRPTVTRTYTEVLTDLDAKIDAATGLLSSDVTAYDNQGGTYPVRAIRWNASSNKFERRNSANDDWESLSSNHNFTAITTSGNITASGNISGVDITASDELQAARVNVTGTTAPANGLYRPATNEIRLTTNSNDRLTIESNGEVGIGVVDPAQKLHVNGNARITNGTSTAHLELGKSGGGDHASNFSMYSDNSANYGFRIVRASGTNGGTELTHNGTGNLTIETVDAADILFKTGTHTRMVIDSSTGRVCIGANTSPDDFLHVHQGTGEPVYIRVQNNEGYTTFGTDANASFINAETHNLRNRAGSSTYLIASTSLFDIKTAAKVNGNLQVTSDLTTNDLIVTDFIRPSVGNSDSKGILFPQNPGGGSGDKAFIRYYVESGENTKLHIGINNDADDDIYLESSLVHTSGAFTVNGTCTATTFVGAVTGTASNASKLNSLSASSSGNRFDVVPFVDSSGDLDIGKELHFHTTDNSSDDEDGKITSDGTDFVFNQHLMPTGSRNLGSSGARWQNLYINDLQLSNKGQTNDVDGTWGDYTIQEGENDLYLLNRRNGKAYKFNLTEVGQVS